MTEVFGYFGALMIGLVLGVTGGGGSILSVPVLVYILHINPVIATGYSLFIVGTTSGFGVIQNYLKKSLSIKTALLFAIPSLIAVYLTRKYLIPAIPKTLFDHTFFEIKKETFLMVLFSIIMLLASISMLKNNKTTTPETKQTSLFLITLQIFLVGVLIGLIGAGGGFLIIPALIHFAKLEMKKAIGTSLLIITINSLIGFLGDLQNINVEWLFLLKFTFMSMLGIFIGVYISKYVNDKTLKKIFGWFVLIISLIIISKELLRNIY